MMVKLLLAGTLTAQASPGPGTAECERYAQPVRHLADRASDRLLELHNPRYSLPPHRPRDLECAVITFTLTAEGTPTQLRVLAASSERAGRKALSVVRKSRYSAGEEEAAALVVEFRLGDD